MAEGKNRESIENTEDKEFEWAQYYDEIKDHLSAVDMLLHHVGPHGGSSGETVMGKGFMDGERQKELREKLEKIQREFYFYLHPETRHEEYKPTKMELEEEK